MRARGLARAIVPAVRPLGGLVLFLLLLSPAVACAKEIGHEFLPPEHWSYRALARFETLGYVRLPSTHRYTRDDVIRYVGTIRQNVAARNARLGGRDRFNLDRLEEEFFNPESRADPKLRFDKPVVYSSDGPLHLELDADLIAAGEDPEHKDQWDFYGISHPVLRFHILDSWTYELRYRLVMGPERDGRERGSRVSSRERSWRGLTSLYERSYLTYYWKSGLLYFGRDYIDWGPADEGNVILSQDAGSLDRLGGRIRFKNFRLYFTHAILSSTDERYLSAHRLQARFGRVTAALSETVIHRDRLLDPVYVFPFASFYANQFNERTDDNVLWAIDLKVPIFSGLIVDGSFLIDDFQYERGDSTPDNYAFNIGVRSAIHGPVPINLDVRYRQVTMYTYTHRDSTKSHVAGSGDPTTGDPILGVTDGPDTDLLTAKLSVFLLPRWTTTVLLSSFRRGEGNDFRRFEPGDEYNASFPSGVVERTTAVRLGLAWEFNGNSSALAEVTQARLMNEDHVSGADSWRTTVRFLLRWNL